MPIQTQLFRPRRDQRGFTLVEVILVVAIAVMVAGIGVAFFTRSYSAQNLKKGADLVRTEFGKARVRTMRTGDIHAFFFVPGSNQFTVAKYTEQQELDMTDISNPTNLGQYQFFKGLLPTDVFFSAGDIVADSQAQLADELAGSTGSGGVQRILFYGDGTSQNAKLTLTHKNGSSIQVTLRGITGVASVGRVFEPGSN